MVIDDFLRQESEWIKGTGPRADIVMSTRTRLARNIDGFPYSHWADNEQLEEILKLAKDAAAASPFLKGSLFLRMKDLSEIDRSFLVERHLMSPDHTKDPEFKALIVDAREISSVMVNEEDHLRIQVLKSGFNLRECWRAIDTIDTELSKKLPFAYSTKLGYLTACPTNVGTGLRGSVMIHLPALVFTQQIDKVLDATAKIGLNIRGFYGEGTEASGNLFQISNQVSLGRTEDDIIENIEKIIGQIVSREESTRATLLTKNKEQVVDRVWRAYGTLKSAHIITSKETVTLLSTVRLGVDLGIIKDLDSKMVNELFISMQPAHLQKLNGASLSAEERDIKRAELIRSKLK